jgi:hypothetical protein
MWWIRKRAKTIIPVLLLVAVVSGGVLVFLGNSSSDGAKKSDGSTSGTASVNSGEGSPDGSGVRVYKDDEGRIVVSNSASIKRETSLELPQSCLESIEKIEAHVAEFKTAIDADDNSRITMVIYQRLAQDLCSWREYNDLAVKQLSGWFAPLADGTPTSAPDGESTSVPTSVPTSVDTSVDAIVPTSSPAQPSSSTTTTG